MQTTKPVCRHPERMRPEIPEILSRFTTSCRIIYDPFAGCGTVAMLAAARPCYVILADIEGVWVEAARRLVEQMGLGAFVDVVQWDSTLATPRCDCIITSPPFPTRRRGGPTRVTNVRPYTTNPRNLSNKPWREYWTLIDQMLSTTQADVVAVHCKPVKRRGRIIDTCSIYTEILEKHGYTHQLTIELIDTSDNYSPYSVTHREYIVICSKRTTITTQPTKHIRILI